MIFTKALRLALVAIALEASACAALPESESETDSAAVTSAASEQATAQRLESLRGDPARLEAFLRRMPKGGDLHNHLSGAVYAESYIQWAREDGLCVNRSTFSLMPASQCQAPSAARLPEGPSDPLYGAIVRAWSMEGFTPTPQESGHDHFFNTFGKFGLIAGARTGDMLAEAANRAAAEGELYLELMLGISASKASQVGDAVWGTTSGSLTANDFASMHERLLAAPGWSSVMTGGTQALDRAEAKQRAALGCDGASGQPRAPGCDVKVRYLYQTSRTSKPHQVFAQFVAAFEIAMREPRVVGMNLVAPEDNRVSLRDYDLQMSMLDFLHQRYVGRSPLHVSLHAGELAASILPPESHDALTFHIRRAVEVGHAERIGHGVDVLSEVDSAALLDDLRKKNVLIETCLSSNDAILSVSGMNHPLSSYLAEGVPVALATDDPGVSRSNLTLEYVRAVTDQGLGYVTLKRLTRESLEHSFLPGESLWRSLADTRTADDCADLLAAPSSPSPACVAFLARNERAQLQWELERRLDAFEHAD